MKEKATISPSEVDAVIFDMDGVVTQTAKVHAAAWKQLFDEYLKEREQRGDGPFAPFDIDADYRRYVDGKPRYDGVVSFLASRGISLPYGEPDDPAERETVCGLGNRKDAYFWQRLSAQGVEAYESTVALLRRLRGMGIKTGIFSASKNAEAVLKAANVLDLFDVKVDGMDAEELGLPGKPDPAVLLEAARRLHVDPGRAVVVEDAIAGVQAGRAGRFSMVIGVNRSGQAGVLLENGADVEVVDLSEVKLVGGDDPQEDEELPSALSSREEILARLTGKRLAVFLDYDGTLTPIVDNPDQAVLSGETRHIVDALARRCTVAIISGRDLADVRRHVGNESIYYAGSHGFDIAGPGGWHTEYERAAEFLPALDEAEEALEAQLGSVPGAWVERKKFAIAVHYRQAREEDVPAIEQAVDRVAAAHRNLRKAGGKKVFELRPRIDWHKGKVVLWLLERLGLSGDDVLPFYIGDDVTDEDAFKALREKGIGIVVRARSGPTAARYALKSPGEVRGFLAVLVEELEKDL